MAIPEEGAATASTAAAGGAAAAMSLWLVPALGSRIGHCKRFWYENFTSSDGVSNPGKWLGVNAWF